MERPWDGMGRVPAIVLAAGVAGGVAGAAYVAMLHVVERGMFPQHSSRLVHGLILVGVGLSVALLTRLLGRAGDVELLVDNIHVSGGAEDVRGLRSLIPISLLCVGSGGGLGPEAPLVQTTGTIGSVLARRFGLAVREQRIVTITGMAAGFTVLFGAPLGSAVFALEILHRRGLEYHEALLPAAVGSLAGYGAYVGVTGAGLAPVWRFGPALPLHGGDLLWAVPCGVAGAVVAAAFTYTAAALRRVFAAMPEWARPVTGGVVLAALAFVSPYALTFGEGQLGQVTTREIAAGTLLVAVVAKLAGSAVTLVSGWRGGFIIPLFFMGACLGVAAHHAWPGTNEVVLVTALMVAANVGVTKTPIGSVLVVTEMAGTSLLPTTLIAAVVAMGLTSGVGLIHSQREREAV